MKICTKCKKEKSLAAFYRDKTTSDGYEFSCKTCKKEYQKQNKEEILTKGRERYKNRDVEKERKRKRIEKKKRYHNNISYRISCTIRSRISNVLAGRYKTSSTEKLLGCTFDQLKEHLESLFEPDMSWDNYGELHIDHIKPCVSFNLSIPEQQKECFNYKNLQPLWAKNNLSKGCKCE